MGVAYQSLSFRGSELELASIGEQGGSVQVSNKGTPVFLFQQLPLNLVG